MINRKGFFVILVLIATFFIPALANDSLKPLPNGKLPQNLKELWGDYDPRAEPLELSVEKHWLQDGIVCNILRFKIGTFNGEPAWMYALYGYPKGQKNLPALMQIHGGGQHANLNAVIQNAKRGYACMSVDRDGKDLQGINQVLRKSPNTHWGKTTKEKGIDPIKESPRNNGWFRNIISCRRALTCLEQQRQVDKKRIGVYGHSVGGKVTHDICAIDNRVKAASPSCGGMHLPGQGDSGTISSLAYAPLIKCPILYMAPSNDFHGSIDGIEEVSSMIQTKDFRYTRVPHLNHRTQPNHVACSLLWFDQWLKGTFSMPSTPQTELIIKTENGIPEFKVIPDTSKPVKTVDVYYTWGKKTTDRFWHYVQPKKQNNCWIAALSLLSVDKPLRVFANVTYPLDEPVTGASYYYQTYTATEFTIASHLHTVSSQTLKKENVTITEKPSLLIEDFGKNWKKEWYTFDYNGTWPYRTRKLNDPKFAAPEYAKLAIDIKSQKPNKLIIEVGNYIAELAVKGGNNWETFALSTVEFKHKENGTFFLKWQPFEEMSIGPNGEFEQGDEKIKLGGEWNGPLPEFRNLRWIECTKQDIFSKRPFKMPQKQGRLYLNFKYADVFSHGWKAQMDKSCLGDTLQIGDKKYEHGIGTHADSEAIFFVNDQFKKLHTDLGVQNGQPGTVVFQIYLDDQKAFDSGIMTEKDTAKTVDLSIETIREIKLIVSDSGNGIGADHANWADLYVE